MSCISLPAWVTRLNVPMGSPIFLTMMDRTSFTERKDKCVCNNENYFSIIQMRRHDRGVIKNPLTFLLRLLMKEDKWMKQLNNMHFRSLLFLWFEIIFNYLTKLSNTEFSEFYFTLSNKGITCWLKTHFTWSRGLYLSFLMNRRVEPHGIPAKYKNLKYSAEQVN